MGSVQFKYIMITIKKFSYTFRAVIMWNLHLPMSSEMIKIINFVQVAIAEDTSTSIVYH